MFLVISETAISLREETLDLKLMQKLVGIPDEPANIEFVNDEFSDRRIDFVCDEEFLYKACSPTCITPRRKHILHGQVLIVGCKNGETVGLNQQQLKVIKQQLIVLRELTSVPARKVWFTDVSKSLRT